jgi:penicillin-binding protein 2
MTQPPEERRPPLTPQLALRVAVVGSIALGMFAIIFFRLWFLQVLSGPQYVARAQVNRTREIEVAAPRGEILDHSGHLMVDSTQSLNVQISPPDLPVPPTPSTLTKPSARDTRVYNRLASVLGISTRHRRCRIPGVGVARLSPIACDVAKQQALLPYANVTIKQDVGRDVQFYLAERQNEFPGVSVATAYQRRYPLNETAAQLFGTVGPITAQEVKERRYRGVSENDVVGQSGLEYYYDHYLRGVDGAERVQVNSLGQFTRYLSTRAPVAGHDLRLSLDIGLQQVGQRALAQSIASNPPANGGAFVAMNPVDGQIYAMGSNPTFNPNIFTKPISEAKYRALTNPASGFPLINRAIQSAGPTGSTFKPITATAALESGAWSPGQTYDDTGQFCEGGGLCRHNAGGGANGVLNLVDALRVSDDVFFYNLGALLNNSQQPGGGALQHWARLYGIGQSTGVDLGAGASGTLPSPRWRANRNALEAACERKRRVTSCGIADGRPWSEGDNVNLAVGQGDVQVSPLQLAVAYSAIANYGKIVRPHLGLDIEDPDGTVLQKIDAAPARQLPVNPAYLNEIRQGLHAAAQSAGGTSDDVFGNFPEQVYGKTGTAQYNGQQDYSWYACFVPASATSKPIVVVVWVEQGGFGAAAAAPVARQILSEWFFGKPGQFVVGSSHTL